MEYQNFSSMPPEQEQSFVIYERTTAESSKKAMTLGAIAGGIVGVFAVMLFLSFDAPINAHAVELETDIEEEAPAPAPVPAPEAAPEPAAVDPEAAAAEPAAADPAAADPAAPTPPAGATKAPPTALIGK